MNTNRIIEGTTLMSIGVFCASVLVSFALQSSTAYAAHGNQVAVVELPAVTITAKRMTAAEKLASLKSEQAEAQGRGN
ncbi:MAG TPA: hypothetical protein VNW52_07000 [Burkholderiaceae bacterium]|jgi:hypothetical protein|nr:hypothetical protein [Burkholderiaceae bacterium]